jgi:hypothetical protein
MSRRAPTVRPTEPDQREAFDRALAPFFSELLQAVR